MSQATLESCSLQTLYLTFDSDCAGCQKYSVLHNYLVTGCCCPRIFSSGRHVVCSRHMVANNCATHSILVKPAQSESNVRKGVFARSTTRVSRETWQIINSDRKWQLSMHGTIKNTLTRWQAGRHIPIPIISLRRGATQVVWEGIRLHNYVALYTWLNLLGPHVNDLNGAK